MQVHEQYVTFTNTVKEDVALARLGEIDGFQVDSILVGSMVHQYFGKEKFGEDPWNMEGQTRAPSSDSGRLEDQRIRGPFDQTAVETIQYEVQPGWLNTRAVIACLHIGTKINCQFFFVVNGLMTENSVWTQIGTDSTFCGNNI